MKTLLSFAGPSFLYLSLTFLNPALTQAASGEMPTVTEVKDAIQVALQKMGKHTKSEIKVRDVLSCYPMYESKAGELLCLVDMNNPDGEFSTQKLTFRKSKTWEVLVDNEAGLPSPACPSKQNAESLLRDSLKDNQLSVTSSDEEGTFSDERGMSRDKRGPLRLMCTYSVQGRTGDLTVVGYFQYRDGKYVLDADREIWNE